MELREQEREVFQEFKNAPANVVEAWALYDSIIICPQFYGSEANIGGWFNTYAAFGGQETHSFFKTRTEGTAGTAYCNQQSSDSMDFAFIAHSVGLSIQVPAPKIDGVIDPGGEGVAGDIRFPDMLASQWFGADLVEHMAIQIKIQQDIRAEITALHCPPGYGSMGGGVATDSTVDIPPSHGEIPVLTHAVNQGVPVLTNRYPLPSPIGIPRTGTIEGILHVSEYGRDVLTNITGPRDFMFNSADGAAPYTFFPQRIVIQLSLFGERMVQQRGQYHK
jgi:hypothetical protein